MRHDHLVCTPVIPDMPAKSPSAWESPTARATFPHIGMLPRIRHHTSLRMSQPHITGRLSRITHTSLASPRLCRYLEHAQRIRALETRFELAPDDPLASPCNLKGPRPPTAEERRAALVRGRTCTHIHTAIVITVCLVVHGILSLMLQPAFLNLPCHAPACLSACLPACPEMLTCLERSAAVQVYCTACPTTCTNVLM